MDASHFGEDPLRALRAVQLAARFELTVDPATAALCRSMPLRELPAERVLGEIEKLLLEARRPSIGLRLMKEWGMLPVLAPELVPLADTPQDPEWHPEGDVWTHTLLAVDQAASLLDGLDRPRALAVMLATSPTTSASRRRRRESKAGYAPSATRRRGCRSPTSLLERWGVHTLHGYDVRGQVKGLVGNHLKPGQLYDDRERVSDGAIRRLARKCEPALLYRVARADCLGRTGDFPPVAMEWFLERVQQLEVTERPPRPILMGRHVVAMGVPPGPEVGRIVHAVYERQLDGAVTDLDQARGSAEDDRDERMNGTDGHGHDDDGRARAERRSGTDMRHYGTSATPARTCLIITHGQRPPTSSELDDLAAGGGGAVRNLAQAGGRRARSLHASRRLGDRRTLHLYAPAEVGGGRHPPARRGPRRHAAAGGRGAAAARGGGGAAIRAGTARGETGGRRPGAAPSRRGDPGDTTTTPRLPSRRPSTSAPRR